MPPGVFVQEAGRVPPPITGVATSVAAFLGETERGSTGPRLVTSEAEYRRHFGDVRSGDRCYFSAAVRAFFENGGDRLYVCRVVSAAAAPAFLTFGSYAVRACGAGAWGNRVWARVGPSSSSPGRVRIQLAYWADADAELSDPFTENVQERFGNLVKGAPTVVEDFDGLVFDPASADDARKRLRSASALAVFEQTGVGDELTSGSGPLVGGQDGDAVGVSDFEGPRPATDGEPVQGLRALEQGSYRDVALVYAPYPRRTPEDVLRAVVAHCERVRFRFAVIDPAPDVTSPDELTPRVTVADSPFAATYFPWLSVPEPASDRRTIIPPGGAVLGAFARVDRERGVFTAPADELLRGVVDVAHVLHESDQETLTGRGVNAIRAFPNRGIRIWGARTLSSDAGWRYVSIRRLSIFLEHSLTAGIAWAVFEPNGELLWRAVREAIRSFLRTQWLIGSIVGRTEDQAFFVKADRTTMTQDDLDNGRLVVTIGVALLEPAEFVIFRIGQWTADHRDPDA